MENKMKKWPTYKDFVKEESPQPFRYRYVAKFAGNEPIPEPKKTNVKWKLWLEYLEKGQSVRLPLSKEESRKHASTVRTLVSRFKKNNEPKNFAVRLIDDEEWTGIGIWRIEDR
tara:strand:- start:153 stop:494 length:342 start_codon:yes stop_codon:yes gene_type:complete